MSNALEIGTPGPREARLDPQPDDPADDRQAQDHALADPPDDLRVADEGDEDDEADDDADGLDAIRPSERADPHHDLRGQRELGVEVREERDERGEDDSGQDGHDHAGHAQHDGGIEHRLADPARGRLGALEVARQLVEDRVQLAGRFGGHDHVDVELGEDPGMRRHRDGQLLAVAQLDGDVVERRAKERRDGLLPDDLDAVEDWDPGADEGRHHPAEQDELDALHRVQPGDGPLEHVCRVRLRLGGLSGGLGGPVGAEADPVEGVHQLLTPRRASLTVVTPTAAFRSASVRIGTIPSASACARISS